MQKLTARLDGQGIVEGQEYIIRALSVEDDGFFISSNARVETPEGDVIDIRNAHLAFDLGL